MISQNCNKLPTLDKTVRNKRELITHVRVVNGAELSLQRGYSHKIREIHKHTKAVLKQAGLIY